MLSRHHTSRIDELFYIPGGKFVVFFGGGVPREKPQRMVPRGIDFSRVD